MAREIRVLGACAIALFATFFGESGADAQAADEASEPPALECAASGLPIERQLRQLYLDLLSRPPSSEEYAAQAAKGSISEEDIAELMTREDFYGRMKTYHRALLRANVSASLPVNNDNRLQTSSDGNKPLETRGNTSVQLRGRNGQGCDHFIPQDDCKNPALQEDPQAEGPAASKVCRDAQGVPLPVSFDYDSNYYACSALTGASSCSDAVTKGLLDAKLLFFCDMRRTMGVLAPFKCIPDPAKPSTAALKSETLDDDGRVIAFGLPAPVAGASYDKLERCTLALKPRNGVLGTFAIQRGCLQRDGFVMTDAPFWDTSGSAKVAICAIEAQTRAVNPMTQSSCENTNFLSDRACGCGERARRCEAGDGSVFNARAAAISEEPVLITDSVLRNDEDYFHILTTRRSYVNGVLSALYRDKQAPGVLSISTPLETDALPALPYTAAQDQWSEYVRGENASGVLTTPAWLYRFPTQRARVAEFYDAFLCKSFAPPADAIAPDPEDSCNRENNLSKRCGCNYCHATIEPTGAHWGRYGERNAQYLTPELFPTFNVKCRDCALSNNTNCDGECGNYIMQAYDGNGASSLGMLKSYLYRTSEDEPNISGGPRLLVQRMLQTGDLERCAVTRIWREFLGRPMSTQEQQLYLDQLVQDFVAEGRNFKRLIQHVVSSDAYKRID